MSIKIGEIEAELKFKITELEVGVSKVSARLDELEAKVKKTSKPIQTEVDKITSAYNKLAASLDPTVAAHNKFESAQRTLDSALKAGIITQAQHAKGVADITAKYLTAGHTTLTWREEIHHLTERISGLSGVMGKSSQEIVEGLENVSTKVGSLGSAFAGLGVIGASVLAALAVAVIGLGAAFVGLEFIFESIKEGLKVQVVIEQLNNSLRSNGAAAGYSSAELIKLAESLVEVSGREDEAIIAGELILTRFTKIGHEAFPRATKAALDLAQATGKDLNTSFANIGRVLEGSNRSLRVFEEIGLVLLPAQRKALQEMIAVGDVAKYQAFVFDLLEQKIGGAAEAYAKTLAGGVSIAHAEFTEFKEGIASEVIPMLESVFNAIVEQAGGWDAIHYVVESTAHAIGNAVRWMVYAVVKYYEEWKIAQLDLAIIVEKTLKGLADFAINVAIYINDAISKVIPNAKRVVNDLQKIKSGIDSALSGDIGKAEKEIAEREKVIGRITQALKDHKQALQGDTQTQKKHKDSTDELTGANKKAESAFRDIAKAVDDYGEKLSDLFKKQFNGIKVQIDLLSALDKGIISYNLAKIAGERFLAIEAAAEQVERAHRTEIEKLTEAKQKLIDAKDPKGAAQAQSEIDKANASLSVQINKAKELAGIEFDLKQVVSDKIGVVKSDKEWSDKLSQTIATLNDAITGSVKSTRENATVLEIENEQISRNAIAMGPLAAAIDNIIRKRRQQIDALQDYIDLAKSFRSIESESEFSNRVMQIDTSQSNAMQELERKYLDFLRDLGKGSIEQGEEVIRKSREVAELLGIEFTQTAENIKRNLQSILDTQVIASISGASKSTYQLYKDERDRIEQAVERSTRRIDVTTKEGQLRIEQITADGTAAVESLTQQYWSRQLGEVSNALGFMAQYFGGFFAKLQSLVSGIQGAMGFGQSVQNIFGGTSSLAIAAGGVATVVGIFAVVYDFVDKMMKKAKSVQYGGQTSVSLVGGDYGITAVTDGSIKLTYAIKQAIHDLGATLGGAITDLSTIGIRIRNDGKYIAAYVKGQMIGHFTSVDDAIKAALGIALKSAKLTGMISDLVRQGIGQWTSPDIDAQLDFFKKLREISDLASGSGSQLTDTVNHLMDLFDTLSDIREITPAVTQGFADIGTSITEAWQAWSDSITGRQRTPDEILFDKQREAALFNAKRQMYMAELALKKLDLEEQLRLLKARGTILTGGGGGGTGPVGNIGHGPSGLLGIYAFEISGTAAYVQGLGNLANTQLNIQGQYLTARTSLLQAEASVYDQTVLAIEAQINAIEQIIQNMPGEIDIPGISVTGGGTRGSDNRDSVRSFIDDRQFRLAIQTLGEYQQRVAEINREYEQQLEQAGRDITLRAELIALRERELALLRQQQIQSVVAKFRDFLGLVSPFDQVRQTAADLIAQINESPFGNARKATMIERVLQSLNEQLDRMAQESASSLLGEMSQDLERFGASESLMHQVRLQMAIIEHTLKMAHYQAEIAILEAEGRLAPEVLAALHAAFGFLQTIDITQFVDPITTVADAANNAGQSLQAGGESISNAAEDLHRAVDSLLDYQRSLRTDSSLGMINPRLALENSFKDYQLYKFKALGGDLEAIKMFKDIAETYRRNLMQYSPSIGLRQSQLLDIDSTISQIAHNAGMIADPVSEGLNRVNQSIVSQSINMTNSFDRGIRDLVHVNDNSSMSNVSSLQEARDKIANQQDKTTKAVQDLTTEVRELNGNIASWRSEDRGRGDRAEVLFERSASAVERLNSVLVRDLPVLRKVV